MYVCMYVCIPKYTSYIQQAQNGKSIKEKQKNNHRLVGKLIDLSHSRPEIAFSVGIVNQYMHSPSEHVEVVYKILKYLKRTLGRGRRSKQLQLESIHKC